MDKSKIVAELQVDAILSSQFIPIDVPGIVYGSYSEVKETYIIKIVHDVSVVIVFRQ